MSTCTLVVEGSLWRELQSAVTLPLETAGVLLVRIVETEAGDLRALARHIVWVQASAYTRREVDSLSIASHGYVPALGEAELDGCTAIWVHTHPGLLSAPTPSEHDILVDTQIADLFRLRSGSNYYGALVLAPRTNAVSFVGHIQEDGQQRVAISRAWIVGDRLQLIQAYDAQTEGLTRQFDRNVRAFGGDVQRVLRELRVGIVGCGGTGSSVAEQLVRLGVRHLKLFDPDALSESNVTRVYGSTPDMVGTAKVSVLTTHLRRIAPDAEIEPILASIVIEPVARKLASCDVVFGCTDDNAGRLILSRLATYLLVPVFDCGVLLSSDELGRLTGIDGRVTVLVPGQGCLVCRGRIDMARAAAEMLTPGERKQRADEGYAPALGRVEPAVVPFTTAVAAASVSELIERLVGYGPEPRPSEVLLRCHEREVSTNNALPIAGHYCNPLSGKIGAGTTAPFLGQTW